MQRGSKFLGESGAPLKYYSEFPPLYIIVNDSEQARNRSMSADTKVYPDLGGRSGCSKRYKEIGGKRKVIVMLTLKYEGHMNY